MHLHISDSAFWTFFCLVLVILEVNRCCSILQRKLGSSLDDRNTASLRTLTKVREFSGGRWTKQGHALCEVHREQAPLRFHLELSSKFTFICLSDFNVKSVVKKRCICFKKLACLRYFVMVTLIKYPLMHYLYRHSNISLSMALSIKVFSIS